LQRAPRAKIGKGTVDILDLTFEMKKAKLVPGPGNYESYSEFTSPKK